MATGQTQHIGFEEAGPSRTMESQSEGWALKMTTRAPRIKEKLKIFLTQKANPVPEAKEMKCVRDSSGKLHFKLEEWRIAQQISNFYS